MKESSSKEPEKDGDRRLGDEAAAKGKKMSRLDLVSLSMICLAGGGILVRWALVFHPCNEQLWMVPVGLVMLGTPIMVWFAAAASDV